MVENFNKIIYLISPKKNLSINLFIGEKLMISFSIFVWEINEFCCRYISSLLTVVEVGLLQTFALYSSSFLEIFM